MLLLWAVRVNLWYTNMEYLVFALPILALAYLLSILIRYLCGPLDRPDGLFTESSDQECSTGPRIDYTGYADEGGLDFTSFSGSEVDGNNPSFTPSAPAIPPRMGGSGEVR